MPLFESSALLVPYLLCQSHLKELSFKSKPPKEELQKAVNYCLPLLKGKPGKYIIEDLVELAYALQDKSLVEKLYHFAQKNKKQLSERAYFEILALRNFIDNKISESYKYAKKALELGSTNLRLLLFLALTSQAFNDADTFYKVVKRLHSLERNIEPLTDSFFYKQPFRVNQKTIEIGRELLELLPKEGYFVSFALMLESVQRYTEEGEVIKEALKRFPQSKLLQKLLIHYYILTGKVEKAKREASKRRLEGFFYLQLVKQIEDFPELKRAYQEILKKIPTDRDILFLLLTKFATFGYLEGLNGIEEILSKNKIEDPTLWKPLLLAKFSLTGEFNKAESSVIDKLLKRYPDDNSLKLLKALNLAVRGDKEEAKRLLGSINPEQLSAYAESFYYALKTYLLSEDYPKTLTEENTFLRLTYLKVLYHLSRDTYFKTVKRWIEKESSPEMCLFYSNPAWELGDLKTVMEASKLCLQKFPKNSHILNSVGYVMLLVDPQRYLKDAKKLLEEALKVDPQNVDAFDSLGWAYYFEGNYEEALKWIKKALEREPDSAVANYHMAEILLRLNRPCEAKKYLKKAIESLKKFPYEVEPGLSKHIEKLKEKLQTLCGSD